MAVSTPDLSDFFKGDPSQIVLGRAGEKPARLYGRQKPRPVLGQKSIRALILFRMGELEPAVAEYKRLQEAKKALKGI